MKFLIKLKLAKLDKRISKELKDSMWYENVKNNNIDLLSIRDIDRNENWVIEVGNFIDVVLKSKHYRIIIEKFELSRHDLIDFFLLMTIATLPNPLFKSGPSRFSNTLTGSSIYQEIEKQLIPCFNSLGFFDNKDEQERFGHKYASEIMSFGLHIKNAHDIKYGEITLEECIL